MKKFLLSFSKALLEQGTVLFIIFFLIRVVEFFTLFERMGETEGFSFWLLGKAVSNEVYLVGLYLVSLGVLLGLIRTFSVKVYHFLFFTLTIVLVILSLGTTQFYYTTYSQLDHVIFYFSFSELIEIFKTEVQSISGIFLWYYSFSIFCVALVLVSYAFIIHKKAFKTVSLTAVLVGISIFVIDSFSERKVDSNLQKMLSSKVHYFLQKGIESQFEIERSDDFIKVVNRFRRQNGLKPSPLQYQFPLIHSFNEKEEKLDRFFEPFDNAPNVVIVICEGLSSVFSGENARYGSMTPKLDSIFSKSLYWPNALSNNDRTHGAFSNILASMPPGFVRGMLNLKLKPYPNHFSIPKWLVKNGYDASFNYGGWAYFDNYEPFLRMNYVDHIYGDTYYKENFGKDFFGSKNFSWGLNDMEFVELYDSLILKQGKPLPFLDIFLTLSLHSPFSFADQEKYLQRAEKQFLKVNGDMQLYEKNKKFWSTIIYQDQAIINLLKAYEDQAAYENTIFVIVGDHNVNALPGKSLLETYQVPLAIYSPKIKEPHVFQDIVAHTDIAPALFSLIKSNTDNYIEPSYSNWVGSGLSTQNKFHAKWPIYLSLTSGDIVGVLESDTLFLKEKLYEIKEGFELSEINSESSISNYRQKIRDYEQINHHVLENNKLLLEDDTMHFSNINANFLLNE